MNPQQMRLSEQSFGKLSQLAMAVELHEHKRFSLRKDIGQVIGLLKVASDSGNTVIQEKLGALIESLTPDAVGFFRKLGVSLRPPEPTGGTAKQTYRGQVVTKAAPAKPAAEPAAPTGKKRIVYRGKVMYR